MVLLMFLRPRVYDCVMDIPGPDGGRPDIVAATRGGDASLRMDGEVDPDTATLEEAVFWRNIYVEILQMEEAVVQRIKDLMAAQTPEARREVELTNLPVVIAQAQRFRARLGYWESRLDAVTPPAEAGDPH
jgi:hypothetical protein